MKDIAPSSNLRKWFAHKEERWGQFKLRYLEELRKDMAPLKELKELGRTNNLTLLYAARNKKKNNARIVFDFFKKAVNQTITRFQESQKII